EGAPHGARPRGTPRCRGEAALAILTHATHPAARPARNPPTPQRPVRRRTQFGFLLLGIAAFVLLVDQAGPAQLLAQVRQSWPVLLPIVLIYGVVYLASSEAWRLTMHDRPPRISSPRAYAITAWAFALN